MTNAAFKQILHQSGSGSWAEPLYREYGDQVGVGRQWPG